MTDERTDEPRRAPAKRAPSKRAPRRRVSRRQQRFREWVELGGLGFTALVKLMGLAIAANEAFLEADRDPAAFGLAAFMLAGARGVESFLSNVVSNRGGGSP